MARPRFAPSEESRQQVKKLAALGAKHEDIATLIQISPKTLRLHFARELRCGVIEANAKVAQNLFQMACSQKSPVAAIFWMKTRGDWREQDVSQALVSAPPFVVQLQATPQESKVVSIESASKQDLERAA